MEVSVLQFNATGDGVTDDAPAIQSALDSGATKVVIPAGQYSIRRALFPAAGQCLVIDGTVRIADSAIQTLPSDVAVGATTVEVVDGTAFNVGEEVTLHDDRLPIQGGGRKVRRQNAGNARITAVDGNRLTLNRCCARSYLQSANAIIGRQHGAIIIRHSGVRVCGCGTIDGNFDGQLNAAPVKLDVEAGEDLTAASGILAQSDGAPLTDIIIEDVMVRDTTLHGIGLRNVIRSQIRNTTCKASHDKNIMLWKCHDCRIVGNLSTDSRWEDGIMLHQTHEPEQISTRIMIHGNTCINNPRYGIHVGTNIRNIHLANNLCVENGLNLSIYGTDCTSTGDVAIGTTDRLFTADVYRPNVQIPGQRIVLTNLTAKGTRYVGVELSGSDLTLCGGQVGDLEPSAETTAPDALRVADGGWGRGSGEFRIAGDCRIGIAVVPGMTGRGEDILPQRVHVSAIQVSHCRIPLRVLKGASEISLRNCTFTGTDAQADIDESAQGEVTIAN